MEKKNKKLFFVAYLSTAIAVLGASGVVPALPTLSAVFNIEASLTPYVIIVFIFPAILLTPIIGVVSDKFGLKPTLIFCLLLYALAGIACTVTTSFNTLLFMRFIQGIGAAALELLALVIIATTAKETEMRKAMGTNAAVIGVSLCIYPVISGILVDISWQAVFLLALLALPVAYLCWHFIPKNEFNATQTKQIPNLTQLGQLAWRESVRWQYLTIIFIFILLFGVFFSFVPEAADQAGITSGKMLGLIPMTMAVALMLSASRMDNLVTKHSERFAAQISTIAYSISIIGFIFSSTLWQFMFFAALFGIAHGLFFPLTQSILGKNIPKQNQGLFMSINAIAIAAGQTFGPLLTSLTVKSYNLSGAFYLGLVIAGFLFLITFTFPANKLSNRKFR